MSLQQIFDAITPDNIKGIPLIDEAMKIFIAHLEEACDYSIDIKNVLSYENFLEKYNHELYSESSGELRENLLKTYLSSLFTVLSKAQVDKQIQGKVELSNSTKIPMKEDILKILNDEFLVSNREFKQTVGTKRGMKYAYSLAKYLEVADTDSRDFNINEVKPFHYNAEGTIFREVYEQIVKPLSHPIGFTYTYIRALTESIIDVFGLITEYDVKAVEVRNINGEFDIFTINSDDTDVKAEFLTRMNPLTAKLFTEEEYDEFVTVHLNKEVLAYTETVQDGGIVKVIRFTDDTIVKSTINPHRVYYRNYSDEAAGNLTYLKQYSGHVSLYIDYTSKIVPDYQNDIIIIQDNFSIGDSWNLVEDVNIQDNIIIYLFSLAGMYLIDDYIDEGAASGSKLYFTTDLNYGEGYCPTVGQPTVPDINNTVCNVSEQIMYDPIDGTTTLYGYYFYVTEN